MKKIVIAGGNGFLGNMLANFFASREADVVILARHKALATQHVRHMLWDAQTLGDWTKELEGADVLINLTGKNVNCRYTKRNRTEILESRLLSTAILGEAIRKLSNPPKIWINASSATIYNASFDKFQTEESADIGDDFSMTVCKQWEHTFNNYRTPGVRKIIARIGIVLGRDGGALVPLKNLVNIGVGGPQGNGQQYCSLIHETDFCRAIEFLISNEACKGVYNITSPEPITNRELMESLRKNCGVPFGVPMPEVLLKLGAVFIGTETELVLKSRKVFPKRLLDEGFVFEFNDPKTALNNLCGRKATRRLNNILSH